ncbi:hypothetical protein P5V15_014425 [Pogonomyrmex californicus]
MRFNKGLIRTYILKKNEYRKILMKNLGLTSNDANEFLEVQKKVLDIPHHRIIKNCLICQKYNIDVKSMEGLYFCIKMLDCTLEHRINVLKDIGVPVIKTSLIQNMLLHFRKKVSEFKKETNIPAEQDIIKNIFCHGVPDDISQLKLNDGLTVHQYYQACLFYCKPRMFNLPYLDDKALLNTRLRLTSISMIEETLKVLRLDLGYCEKMIKKNPSVIIASADNIRSLLNSFTDILGIPIITFLREYPNMLFEDATNIKLLLASFKQHKIPDEYVKNCTKIFHLGNDIFQERIEIIKRHPELNIWYKHPRILRIISRLKLTRCRMGYIDHMDSFKWARPQSYLCSKKDIEKSLQTGIVSSKFALKYILLKELGVNEVDLLTRHQHWKTIAFIDIVQMLQYLQKYFTIDEIRPNIHIILYKQSTVEKVLAELKQQYSQSTEYSFSNSQYLALCLYMLEKDNNFTGDGIWNNKQNENQQTLEKLNTIERLDDDINTMEDSNNNLSTKSNINHDNDIDRKDIMCKNNIHNINC